MNKSLNTGCTLLRLCGEDTDAESSHRYEISFIVKSYL